MAVAAIASQHYDFRAFYCAGRVARLGADPYRTQPLYACEQTLTETDPAWVTNGPLPAPFPPYTIAAVFESLSLLPYRTAASLWTIALLGSLMASIVLLAKTVRCHPALPAAALCLSAGVASLSFGEIVPLYFLCLCACVYAAHRKMWGLAGVFACGTLIEPHLGLPVCAALALFQARSRVALAAGAGALFALSLVTFGWARVSEYAHPVLHYHALSEIAADRQFALSTVLHWLGVADGGALSWGMVSYCAAVLAGLAVARALERRFREPAFLVAAPAAFALFGGVFLHVTQMIAALPFALLLLRALPQAKLGFAAALALLAIPWVWLLNPLVTVVALVVAFAVAWEASHAKTFFVAAAPALACVAFFSITGAPAITRAAAPRMHTAIDPSYAESGWAQQNARYLSTGSADAWARRAPTWAALLAFLGLGVAACASGRSAASKERAVPLVFTPALESHDG